MSTYTAAVDPGPPVVVWIVRNGARILYADRDPSTGAPWPDEATALAWAQAEADRAAVVERDAVVIAAGEATHRAVTVAAPDAAEAAPTIVVYTVRRVQTPWGHAIEAEVLRGYSVVGQLALRTFAPWDGAVPFAEVDGRLIATVVGFGTPEPAAWTYGIWVEGIPLDSQTIGDEEDLQTWLASRLIVNGQAVAGGSVPA